jgi:glutathione S-transferase
VLHNNGGTYMVGRRTSYVDLSMFEIVEGLRYAFPKRMKRFEKRVPGLIALRDRIAERSRIKTYLASKRRIPFSQWGIYRYFKELDK